MDIQVKPRVCIASTNRKAITLAPEQAALDVRIVSDFEMVFDEHQMALIHARPFSVYVLDLDLPTDRVSALEIARYLKTQDCTLTVIFVARSLDYERRVEHAPFADCICVGEAWPVEMFIEGTLEALVVGKLEIDRIRHGERACT
jgi:hypothetical protein